MRPTGWIATATAVAALLLCAGASDAAAAAKPKKKSAAAWYAEGARHHGKGEWAAAIDCYEHAYALDPTESVYLYNLAQANRLAGELAAAARYYELYLADPKAAPALRAEAEKHLGDMRAALAAAAAASRPAETRPAPASLPASLPVPATRPAPASAPASLVTPESPASAPGALLAPSAPKSGGAVRAVAIAGGVAVVLAGAAAVVTVLALRATAVDRYVGRHTFIGVIDFTP
jgi:hypothetical protein